MGLDILRMPVMLLGLFRMEVIMVVVVAIVMTSISPLLPQVNVSSLETVVRHYLSLADERTEAARKESHQAVVDIDDLDNLATPEEILLSAVSGEDAQVSAGGLRVTVLLL